MPELADFSRRIRARVKSLEGNLNQVVRKVAMAADQAVVLGTPVDTGRARSNWIVSVGSAHGDTISAYVPGEKGSTKSENTQAALDQGESVIRNYTSGRDQSIHITNNLPYIQALNDGHSEQAPANFVESAIQEAIAAVGRIVT